MKMMKSTVAGIALALLASTAIAAENSVNLKDANTGRNFSTLNGIPAKAMSSKDMDKTEGKGWHYYYIYVWNGYRYAWIIKWWYSPYW